MYEKYVDEKLDKKLSKIAFSNSSTSYSLASDMIKLSKMHLKSIKRYFNGMMPYSKVSGADKIFFDSFYKIEQMIKNNIKALKNVQLIIASEHGIPPLCLFLRCALSHDGFELCTASVSRLIYLYEKYQKTYLKSIEYDFIKSMISYEIGKLIYEFADNGDFDGTLLKKAVGYIYQLENIDIELIIENMNPLEQLLKSDPSGIYVNQTVKTKQFYRFMVSRISNIKDADELLLTRQYINLCKDCSGKQKHIGFYIYKEYRKLFSNRLRQSLYTSFLYAPAVILSTCLGFFYSNLVIGILLFFPLVEILRPLVDYLIQYKANRYHIPEMDLNNEVPNRFKTVVVVATLLPDQNGLSDFRAKLEKLLITHQAGCVYYSVLCDLKQSANPNDEADKQVIKNAHTIVSELNCRYGDKLVMIVRNRVFSKTERNYSGRERKRGAISDFVEIICDYGNEKNLAHISGNIESIKNSKYMIVLDYDSELLMDSVCKLVQKASHILNTPVVSESGVVTNGYAVFAPKNSLDLKSSLKTYFTQIMGGIGGTMCYDQDTAELYQDIYGSGIFNGKGLIDVKAYFDVLCKNKCFENETVLSHDIIEGEYLKTCFAGDVEIIDGMPDNVSAYYKRLHRWIRGDSQNSAFLSDKKLSTISKYKIFDNIRRAITPAFSLVLIIAGAYSYQSLCAFGVTAIASQYLFTLLMQILHGKLLAITTNIHGAMNCLSRELIRVYSELAFLPIAAIKGIDGFVRGVYRRYISKRHMLEWTAASQVESQHGRKSINVRIYIPCVVLGTLLVLSHHIFSLIIGIIFISAIVYGNIISLKRNEKKASISQVQRNSLVEDVKKMFLYYENHSGKESNYLPPDNVQSAPLYKVAYRTSPTNIGMMLLSYLSAADFNIINRDKLISCVENTVGIIERLEKYHGNLYNWYDVKTLVKLEPAFVSTVDSGNLLCCLVALKEGLKDYSAPYRLINRIESLISYADLSIFYNRKKKLFHIGYDTQSKQMSNSYYDMLMSEARMTSYFAIATSQAPKEHWSALSRLQSRTGFETGAMAWTGTMFEFFMPELLLHCIKGSIGYQALWHCIKTQKMRVENKIPYGISESGIYEFDGELNYQYKANGVQRNALKQGMNDELVISPYSTYITLNFDFSAAYENLERLKKMNVNGEFGLYEALDYTQRRIGENEFVAVQSHMAHHLGMSIVAINNALNNNIIQKRFMRDVRMRSADELLQEKCKAGEVIMYEQVKRERNGRIVKISNEAREYLGHMYPNSPRVKVLSNDKLSCVLTDLGSSYIQKGGTDITRRTTDLLRNSLGTFCFMQLNQDNDKGRFSLTYAPQYRSDIHYEATATPSDITFHADTETLKTAIEVRLHRTLPIVQRQITLQNKTKSDLSGGLIIYIEPCLFPFADDSAHKAFSKLFLSVDNTKYKIVTATRRKRGGEEIFNLAVGIREQLDFELISSREDLFERGNVNTVKASAFNSSFESQSGVPDPCIALRFDVLLRPNESKKITLVSAVSDNLEDAVNLVKASEEIVPETSAKSRFAVNSLEDRISQSLLPQILYKKRNSGLNLNAISNNKLGKNSLWSLGISGDKPVALVDVLNENDIDRVKAYAVCHAVLRLSGIDFDLVFLHMSDEKAEQMVRDMVISKCGNNALHNSNPHGSVFVIDKFAINEELLNLLQAFASHTANRSMVKIEIPTTEYSPIEIKKSSQYLPKSYEKNLIEYGFFSEDSFFITKEPPLPWCNIISNRAFGTLLSDKALGYTWAINSRENKLTPWNNDTIRDNDGELLILGYGTRYYNLVDGAIPEFNPEYVCYHSENSGIRACVKVTVPEKGMIKLVDIELENLMSKEKEVSLSYYIEPAMSVDREHSKMISAQLINDNTIVFNNPFNLSGNCYMGFAVYENTMSYTCERQSFFNGDFDMNQLPPNNDMCCAITVKKRIKPKSSAAVRFALCFSVSEGGIEKQLRLFEKSDPKPYRAENTLCVSTKDFAIDKLVNTWLPHQMLSARINGRTGFYQCGGAYGFRDQLQDVLSALLLSPSLARQHIIRCCANQFEPGDVFHWWHTMPKFGGGIKGIRTRYSDDLVWLPYVTARYVEATGDRSILDVDIAYLKADEIPAEQKDSYLEAVSTDYKESVRQHCQKALERSYNLGKHGLPKMGSGDWNDGYSSVGDEGVGESVWLAQFMALTLKLFAHNCICCKDDSLYSKYTHMSNQLLVSVDKYCYDTDHYIRAFYDNGEKMGSYESDECKVDSLTQSFSALSDMSDFQRINTALETAYSLLVDESYGIIKLFTPSFHNSDQEPGYVKAYPRGVRENGGQYTHAAVWFAMAMYKTEHYPQFEVMSNILNPIKKYQNKFSADKYKTEPYAMSADVYTNSDCYARGGWSLYTGAAGWYYQLLTQCELGIRLLNGKLTVKENSFKHMDYKVRYEYGENRKGVVDVELKKGKIQ